MMQWEGPCAGGKDARRHQIDPPRVPRAGVNRRNTGSATARNGEQDARGASVVKRQRGLNRCHYEGAGMKRWVGLGVIADNLISMGNAKKANPPSLDRVPHERPSGNCWRYYTTLTASAARERDKSRRHCAEIGLEYWFQYELGGSLNHAIADDRIAERTPASPIWFAARLQARCIPMITLRRWRFAWHT